MVVYIPTYIRTEVRLRRHKGARFARPNYVHRLNIREGVGLQSGVGNSKGV